VSEGSNTRDPVADWATRPAANIAAPGTNALTVDVEDYFCRSKHFSRWSIARIGTAASAAWRGTLIASLELFDETGGAERSSRWAGGGTPPGSGSQDRRFGNEPHRMALRNLPTSGLHRILSDIVGEENP
jgi:hypothetical protein